MSSSAYRELFRDAAVPWEALTGLLAQVSQGGAGIGLILVIRAHGGSYVLAGSVVGALNVAAGVIRPIQGRLIDRRGAGPLMATCGVVHPAALAGIVALAQLRAPGVALLALGVVAGAALPPLSTSMRVTWGTVLPDAERTAAYSLVYLTQELAILTGPLIVSVCLEVANASVAVLALAAVTAGGTFGFAVLAGRRHATRAPRAPVPAGGVWRSPPLRTLIAISALIGAVVGSLEVAVPTTATAHHASAATGLLIAALAVGGIAGAALYGSRRWPSSPGLRLCALLAALTALLAAVVPVGSLVILGVLLLAAGGVLNPALTTGSLLVDDHVAPAAAAEAFGWLSFGIAGGQGAANAIAGALTHAGHATDAFLLAALAAGAAALLAAGRASRA
ncbi:MAG TPA: MFS transporter [Solirubrobacteraceae bacterium]|jgi:MFS family permease|nr:MFS transporter [Solirubrobacteraceae bacterium]